MVRRKKWKPFPFQKDCWNAYLKGSSGLLMAPTGSGKTLALGAPILQSIDPHKKGLQALWITPLRALSQEIFEALEKTSVAMKLDIEVGLRNGDTSTKERTKQRKSLPPLLITTPESLQLLLASKGYETRFKHLRSIVIDEWHDLYASKRGALLELGLSRLRGINPKLQVWGISATLGDPLLALSVLKGSVIENEKVPNGWTIIQSNLTKEILIESLILEKADRFPWRGHLGLHLIDQIGPLLEKSKSILIFTNTRSQCEIWFQALLSHYPDLAGQMAMHHSSIEKNTRLWVENALRNESLKVVVCTSSLDLGVDFAPVETVIQVGGPKSIARLMQRAGRSGHQPGAQSKLYFLPTHAMEIIESAALKIAVQEKQIEASIPYLNSYDLLIQYLTTLAVSDGFYPHQILPEIQSTFCFQTLSEEEWNWILRFITTGGDSLENYDEYQRVTIEEDGKYLVTKRSIAMRHRFQIGTIVSDATLAVHFISGGFIGTLEEWFVSQLQPGDHFTFAGRVLEFIRVREMKVQVRLSKTKSSKVPAWMGGRLSFSSEMSMYLQSALAKLEKKSKELTKEIKGLEVVFEAQKKESIIPDKNTFLAETFKTKEGYHHLFYTFEGRFINEALANLLAYRLSLLHPISCSLAYNDYGFELLSDQPIDIEEIETQELWSTRDLMIDLRASINLSELSRRSFRDIAVISGLVFNGYPGKPVKTKHLQSSSQLVYEVFKSYEPDNLLMLQAEREVFEHQLEFDRLKGVLENINRKNTHIARCEKPTPFSFPIITDRLRARLSNEDLEKRIQKNDSTAMTLNFADQSFELHPSGALFWPNGELLIISDVHLGKITHFRKHGMPLPNDAVAENFEKLDQVIDYFNPAELIFLGDLFHSSFNNEFDQFKLWVENQSIPVQLIKGNHEVLEDSTYESFGIEVESHITFDTFRLQHHPEEDDNSIPVICGHIHPAYLLKGKARDQIKLKCFHATETQLTLPAFGVFTGSHLITPQPNDQIVLLTGDRLIAI